MIENFDPEKHNNRPKLASVDGVRIDNESRGTETPQASGLPEGVIIGKAPKTKRQLGKEAFERDRAREHRRLDRGIQAAETYREQKDHEALIRELGPDEYERRRKRGDFDEDARLERAKEHLRAKYLSDPANDNGGDSSSTEARG